LAITVSWQVIEYGKLNSAFDFPQTIAIADDWAGGALIGLRTLTGFGILGQVTAQTGVVSSDGVVSGLAQLTDGRVVAAVSNTSGSTLTGFRLYDAALNPLGPAVLHPDLEVGEARVAALQNGGFVIVGADRFSSTDSDIDIRIHDASGALEAEVTADASLANDLLPKVAVLDDGNIAVTWVRPTGSVVEIWAMVLAPDGSVLATPRAINATASVNFFHDVTAIDGGGFVVVCEQSAGGGLKDIRLVECNGVATVIGDRFITPQAGAYSAPALQRLPDGLLAVTWANSNLGNGDLVVQIGEQTAASSLGLPVFVDGGLPVTDNLNVPAIGGMTHPAISRGLMALAWHNVTTNSIGGEMLAVWRVQTGDANPDTFLATAWFDSLVGGAGIDTVDYINAPGPVGVSLINGGFSDGFAFDDEFDGIENLNGSAYSDTLGGNDLANIINGDPGNDSLLGLGGADLLYGGTGNDRLDGGAGNDTMAGGGGNDIYHVDAPGDVVQGEVGFAQGGGIDTVFTRVDLTAPANVEILRAEAGVAGIDLTGNDAPGTLVGNEGANRLDGRGGNDQLNGNAGNDVLTGGEGADTLVGGAGADQFVFNAVSNSRAGAASRDVINGFDRGAVQDRIDLSAIDANTATAANDAFTFIGSAAFTAAGQVRIQSLGGPNAVIVEINVNADPAADMQIFVNLTTTMGLGDFLL
jgi:Ca2+-binding RTX toxin-like protein